MTTKRVLIAEDDEPTREMLARFAAMRGYDVISAANGVELLSFAAGKRFDAIITDLMMPDLDGASATEIMKLEGNTTPVIALTGLDTNAISLVADKFARVFRKPINIGDLFDYVESLQAK
jgi:DNA-binding response OmpR family regulator